jgi:DNA-binding NarL/FixJ family response regulator
MYSTAQPYKAIGMKILVVDDHALIRDALRGVLRELVEDAIVLEARRTAAKRCG